MKNLSELQNRNVGLPGMNSRNNFKDSHYKIENFKKHNMYNISNLIKKRNLEKRKTKNMTEN